MRILWVLHCGFNFNNSSELLESVSPEKYQYNISLQYKCTMGLNFLFSRFTIRTQHIRPVLIHVVFYRIRKDEDWVKAGFHICCLHRPSWGAGVQPYRTKENRWGIASMKISLVPSENMKILYGGLMKTFFVVCVCKTLICFYIFHNSTLNIVFRKFQKYKVKKYAIWNSFQARRENMKILLAVMFGIFRWADRNFIIMHMFSSSVQFGEAGFPWSGLLSDNRTLFLHSVL